ncbi:MAG: alpha/beta hydrolase [Pseudomonadota bacterium]
MVEDAPFYHDVAEGPPDARAYWCQTSDGVRVRAALWPSGTAGTVLMLNGRTECVEKYARLAETLGAAGFASASVDWRGQGLSDRLAADPNLGHVGAFLDFQKDVAALLDLVRSKDMPEPYFLIAHSMGGAVGLRALLNELPVRAAVFSAPMWGIRFSPPMRPVAWALSWTMTTMGLGARFVPSTVPQAYLIANPFKGNDLTTDPEQYAYMRNQVERYPALGVGGPSARWLTQALHECAALMGTPGPQVPTLVGLGSREAIVDAPTIRTYAAAWPEAELVPYEGAEHELLMERADVREDFIARAVALFQHSA